MGKIILILTITTFINPSFAKIHLCDLEKSLPKLLKGCEGEACGFTHYDYAISDFKVFEKPNKKSKVAGIVKKCNYLKSIKSYTKKIKMAKAKVTSITGSLKSLGVSVGDTITIKMYDGEGWATACVKDKNIEVFFGGIEMSGGVSTVKSVSEGKSVEWTNVKDELGVSGWTRRDGEKIMWAYELDNSKKCSPGHKFKSL
jgi:hypothetical protein